MTKIMAIAFNTFKEAVRNRILYILLVFALLILAGSGIIGELTISARERIIKDLGLASINFFGLLIAVFVGIGLVYNELDKKTIYTIVTKPIDRYQFLIGKYLGLLLTIYVIILVMMFFFLGVIHYQNYTDDEIMTKALWQKGSGGEWINPTALDFIGYYVKSVFMSGVKAIGNIFLVYQSEVTRNIIPIILYGCLEMAIITSFAILYSSFSTPTLSALLTIMTFVIGRLNADIMVFAERLVRKGLETGGDKFNYYAAKIAALVTPNLWLFNKRTQVEAEVIGFDIYAVAYAVFYTAAVLFLAITIFRKRNFK